MGVAAGGFLVGYRRAAGKQRGRERRLALRCSHSPQWSNFGRRNKSCFNWRRWK